MKQLATPTKWSMATSERSSNTTKIETLRQSHFYVHTDMSERSSNTTKIETNVREMQQDQGQSQKEVLTQQRLKPPII